MKSRTSDLIKTKTNQAEERALLANLRVALDGKENAAWEAGTLINELKDTFGWTTAELAPYFRHSRNRLDEFASTARAFPKESRNPALSFEAHHVAKKAAKNAARGMSLELNTQIAPDFKAAIACRSLDRGGKTDARNTTKEILRKERARREPQRLATVAKISAENRKMISAMIHGDAVETISSLTDRSAKMIHLDPPYANYKKTTNGKLLGDCSTDANHCDNDTRELAMPVIIAALNASVPKLVHNGVLLLWQSGYPIRWQIAKAIEDAGLFAYPPIIWNKQIPQMGDPAVIARTSCEICYIMCREGERPLNFLEEDGVGQVISCKRELKRADNYVLEHQMQKPAAINEELLRRFSEAGDLIVDAFGCSASMCLAAEKMQRKWVYSESNKHNYKLGVRNIEDYFSTVPDKATA